VSTTSTPTTIPQRVLARGAGASTVWAPIGFGVLFLGLWQLLVVTLHIEPFLVPSPLAIVGEFTTNFSSWPASGGSPTAWAPRPWRLCR
jgi:ABC-type nitrate/sulfonate/bicarbonate transport system permease component